MKTLVGAKSRTEGAARFDWTPTERDSHNPLHWMPVPMPGLSVPQLQAFMQEVDKRPYSPPLWVQIPQAAMRAGQPPTKDERDPKNPTHWMPVPPPVVVID